MTDLERLDQLITARHPCIAVSTFEEDYVLGLLRHLAVERQRELWLWSVTIGWREGLLAGAPPMPDTEHAAAALYHIIHHGPKHGLYVATDMAGHLKDEKTLRLLREAVCVLEAGGGHLVLLDHHDKVPHVIRSLATRFEVSFPDEQELEDIVRQTVRKVSEVGGRIAVNLTRPELQ